MSRLVSIYNFKTKYLEYFETKRHQVLRTSKQSSSINMLNFLVNYSSFLYCSCYEQPKNVIRRRKLKSWSLLPDVIFFHSFSLFLLDCLQLPYPVFLLSSVFCFLYLLILSELIFSCWLSDVHYSMLTTDQGSLCVDLDAVEDSLTIFFILGCLGHNEKY